MFLIFCETYKEIEIVIVLCQHYLTYYDCWSLSVFFFSCSTWGTCNTKAIEISFSQVTYWSPIFKPTLGKNEPRCSLTLEFMVQIRCKMLIFFWQLVTTGQYCTVLYLITNTIPNTDFCSQYLLGSTGYLGIWYWKVLSIFHLGCTTNFCDQNSMGWVGLPDILTVLWFMQSRPFSTGSNCQRCQNG